MFKKNPSEFHLIGLTFLAVLLLAAPTFWSLIHTDSPEVSGVTAPVAITTSLRQPASVATATLNSRFAEFDLSCARKPSLVQTVSGRFIQIQGRNCLKHFNVEKLEIVNRSNGYTASVFPRGVDHYQTDLIQLQDGDNEISIRYSAEVGTGVEEVLKIKAPQI